MENNLEQTLNEFSQRMKVYKLPQWKDLPEIDLYMDQVIALMEKYLSNLIFDEDSSKLITPSMINNYVKLEILPPPIKKKYSREHIAYLLIICSLKQVMPISRIKEIINLKLGKMTIEELLDAYSELYTSTFKTILRISEKFALKLDKSTAPLDTSLYLAIGSSTSRFITESLLKIQTSSTLSENTKDKKNKNEKK